ncbi:MAG: hypothetical protein M2R45_04150 [Verrucomicrobia subdivision 3 bacterium]|nr:hypothetical protein [Limisphaerales bacterium]MCS1417711.1 hypothetical protein [Limisphaerales bacterium]
MSVKSGNPTKADRDLNNARPNTRHYLNFGGEWGGAIGTRTRLSKVRKPCPKRRRGCQSSSQSHRTKDAAVHRLTIASVLLPSQANKDPFEPKSLSPGPSNCMAPFFGEPCISPVRVRSNTRMGLYPRPSPCCRQGRAHLQDGHPDSLLAREGLSPRTE